MIDRRMEGLLILILTVVNFANSQGFDSGSDGSDGALDFSTPGTFTFDPTTFNPPLDQDGDGVFHFTTITIGSGVSLRLAANELGTKPVIWLASGEVIVDGVLDLNGQNGHYYNAAPVPANAGAGGFDGGVGKRPERDGTPGLGPGGGGYGAGNAGHSTVGNPGSANNGDGPGGANYGNIFLLPIIGGSGGGGGGGSTASAGGGAGGGAVLIASSIIIAVNGSISARGGSSGTGVGPTTEGGHGSGGAVRLIAPIISGSGSINCGAPNGASPGRIRVEAFQHLFAGTSAGLTVFSSPGLIFPPEGSPKISVTSIAGMPVPANPLGGFNPADLVINEGGPTTIEVAAENIPIGTIVDLDIWTESTGTMQVQTTPLAGTLASSTATASVTFPHGFSRISIQASWDPL